MYKNLSVFGLLLCVSSFIRVTESVLCYHCEYIESLNNKNLDPDCFISGQLSNDYANDTMQTGVACMKAVGFVDGYRFILRRALKAGPGGLSPSFPTGQAALSCSNTTDSVIRKVTADALKIVSIGPLRSDDVTSCTLCNDKDQCNGAGRQKFGGIMITVAVLGIIGLVHLV